MSPSEKLEMIQVCLLEHPYCIYMYMYGFSLIFISQHFYFIYLLFSADILNHKLQDLTPEQVVGKKSMKHFQGIIVLFYIS